MRLLLTAHQFLPEYFSGTEILTYTTAKELQRRGHEVLVFTGSPSAPGFAKTSGSTPMSTRACGSSGSFTPSCRWAGSERGRKWSTTCTSSGPLQGSARAGEAAHRAFLPSQPHFLVADPGLPRIEHPGVHDTDGFLARVPDVSASPARG